MCSSDIFLALIGILFPPLPVWIKRGLCSADSLINIALCCLAYVPGLLHSWYIIYTTPDYYEYERVVDVEGGAGRGPGGGVYYAYIEAPRTQPYNYGTAAPAPPPNAGQSGSAEVPPSYTEAVKGDNKVQRT